MPVSTVLGRKTVSNILEYIKKMFKGRVKETLLFLIIFFYFQQRHQDRGDIHKDISRSKTGQITTLIIKPNGPS